MFVTLLFENYRFACLFGGGGAFFVFVTTRQLKLNHMYLGHIV